MLLNGGTGAHPARHVVVHGRVGSMERKTPFGLLSHPKRRHCLKDVLHCTCLRTENVPG